MTTTTNLGLTLVEASQAQKEVTVNEALVRIDAVLNRGAEDKDLAAPPGSPAEGDAYLVAASATGDWAGHDGEVAYFNQVWRFIAPNEGMMLWVKDEDALYAYDGSAWVAASSGGGAGALDDLSDVTITAAAQYDVLQHNGTAFVNGDTLQQLAQLGVNATADATYKFSVKSSAVLLEHDGDDMQAVLRKALTADTASALFQVGTSGRAELGLVGNDDFQLRTSSNGSTWNTAFTAFQDGRVSIGGTASFVTRYGTSGTEPQLQIVSTGSAASFFMGRFSNNPYPGRIFLGKSRGATVGAHGAVQAFDELGAFSFAGSDGSTMNEGARLIATASGAPGSNYTPTHLDFYTSDGTGSPARNLSVRDDGALGMGTSRDVVISAARHPRLRSYTVATLPSASNAGEFIYVSDETGGAVPAFSDGTNWRRVTDRAVVA